jgi:cytosine deaminase
MLQNNHYWIINVRIPDCFIDSGLRSLNQRDNSCVTSQRDRLFSGHLEICDGRIAKVLPSSQLSQIPTESLSILDGKQGILIPCFVDLHTHLDKGHIWERSPNLDGTFEGALQGIYRDCTEHRNWNYDDLYRRIDFGLKCSYVHGTRAIRTHLDCLPHQVETTLQVFKDLREAWQDKITLQAVSLVQLSYFETKESELFADTIAELGGLIGGIAHSTPDLDKYLDRILTIAQERNLSVDFHADENDDPNSHALAQIAEASLRNNFNAQIVVGHCCSLALQDEAIANQTIALVKKANLGIVSLPMCNLYLQDRVADRTPRWRGITLVRELDAAGVSVAISSDNCRDPFYGFGDHDLLDVFSMSAKIGHLNTPYGNWIESVTSRPAALMELANLGKIEVGSLADLVLFKARSYSELLSRHQSDRLVFRNGIAIDRTLPDYAELDDLVIANCQPK